MSKETLVFISGILIFFVPFAGLPNEYKKWVLVVIGALLMSIGYMLRRSAFLQSLEHESGDRRSEVFVESPRTFSDTQSHDRDVPTVV